MSKVNAGQILITKKQRRERNRKRRGGKSGRQEEEKKTISIEGPDSLSLSFIILIPTIN